MRLAHTLSGGAPNLLRQTRLVAEEGEGQLMCTSPPDPIAELLAAPDGQLASTTIGAMCVEPRPEHFEALGRVLAEPVHARLPLPGFDLAAMDPGDRTHLVVEAVKIGLRDRDDHLSDPDAMADLLRECFATDPATVTPEMVHERYTASAAPGKPCSGPPKRRI